MDDFRADPDLSDVYITILAGGSGTRLWPRSRKSTPKQLLDLVGTGSLLQQTIDRVTPLVPAERIYILTGPDHAPLIAEQVSGLPSENILIEPAPRGTAPPLGLAALRLRRLSGNGQAVMVSLHADHVVLKEDRFRETLLSAIVTARQGYLVTIGIIPSYPETGFGYIERGESLHRVGAQDVYHVARFTEKPPLEQARQFMESGRFYWNTGYFTWTLDRILGEFQRLLPTMYAQLEQIAEAPPIPAGRQEAERLWGEIQQVTIDVGIMERAEKVAVIPVDLGWSDIGSWSALFDLHPHDAQGNVILGTGEHIGLDTTNTLVYGQGRLIATIGLEDMVVVDTGDALLVLPKSRAQDVSALVKMLRARGLERYL